VLQELLTVLSWHLIDGVAIATILWLLLGMTALVSSKETICRWLFPASALISLGIAFAGLAGLTIAPQARILPLGLPDLPFHLRLDALSSFFLMLLGAASSGISLYCAGYFRSGSRAISLLALQYFTFLAAMAWVMLADDAYFFMVAWETMALASYFLVTTEHENAETRRAGFLYLLIAHVGAIAILMAFGVLQGGQGDYTFGAMRTAEPAPFWASMIFLLALFGFGAKAGLLPVHVWLPEAHPAAPSPVSALMSGIMLKTAIYGLLRMLFDLLHVQFWWWGALMLVLGLLTALFGVLFATVQTDMKRLLAYSSIENIGLIIAGLGLALLFHAQDADKVAALALVATLYHCLNHALFKGVLFLSAGSVLHATGERSLGRLGGLIHTMPWTAGLTLIGTLAIASLPPLNGFVSEWLMLQAYLLMPPLPEDYLNMMLPLGAAVMGLTAALAAYAAVKFFGVIFLGRSRERLRQPVHDAGFWERLGMLWLAAGCVLLGLLPVQVIAWIDEVSQVLLGTPLGNTATARGWLWLAPVAEERASYGPLVLFAIILTGYAFVFFVVRRFYHGRMRRGPAWDCGYAAQTARMQDTAEGFGQPIKLIFEHFFGIQRSIPSPFERHPRYESMVRDRLWELVYLPLARLMNAVSEKIGMLQHGRISIYLLYSFVTLILLLVFVR
jgi:formate hydrogenlyase subunit 3/multisubunit Na+/H+ antiporter MnhD subunit